MERSLREARKVADRWLEKAAEEYGLSTYANYSNMLATRRGSLEVQTRDEIHGCRSCESISRGEESLSYSSTESKIDDEVTTSHSFDSTTVASGVDFHADITMAFSDLTLDVHSNCSMLSQEREESMDETSMNDKLVHSQNTVEDKAGLDFSPKLISQEHMDENQFVDQGFDFTVLATPRITNRVSG